MNNIALKMNQEFVGLYPSEFVQKLEGNSLNETLSLLSSLSLPEVAKILTRVSPERGCELVVAMSEQMKREVLVLMDPGKLSMLCGRLSDGARSEVLKTLPQALSKEIEELVSYPSDRAGFFMDPRPIQFDIDDSVDSALQKIRSLKGRRITDVYAVDDEGVLQAKIPLQEVAIAEGNESLSSLKKGVPVTVHAMSSKEEVVELMETHKLTSLPVIDSSGKLCGVIRYDGLVTIVQQEAVEGMQAMVGVNPEEKALSKTTFAIKKRLPWLSINLVTTFVAAFVVGLFEDTIAKVTALAVLLPVVAGQSGNTGAQAQAVTMRGLALREIRLRHWWHMLRKEGGVGFVNGVVIGLLCAVAVYFWGNSMGLSLVIGTAMVIAMVAASLSGAAIPMILSAVGQDPAQSSSIILTTITDIVGFMTFLGLASIFSKMLVGL